MESELKANLLAVASAFAAARSFELSTVGKLAASDARFFTTLCEDGRSFTARKYDNVLRWFSENWPPGFDWPPCVVRPDAISEEAAR